MNIELTQNETRVIGCLMEKSVTTPDQYPLTINALTSACNQKSSRDPVLSLDQGTVQHTTRQLSDKHLLSTDENFKSRVEKYHQRFCNTPFAEFQFSDVEFAVVCVLLLRGPQTPGELRTRTNRLCELADNQAVADVLRGLIDRDDGPLVARLPRTSGRQDHEYAHLFSGEIESVASEASEVSERTPVRTVSEGPSTAAPAEVPSAEFQARVDVAAAHRLAVRHGLNEGVWNHISMISPDHDDVMMISPGHTHWSQVTASNLALVDSDGDLISGERAPIRAGWIIHHPVHQARQDAKCVIHVHAPYITAMSIRKDITFETRSSQQSARFHDDLVYYEVYDGILDREDEGQRMAQVLGGKRVLMLRNHGALIAAPTVAMAYLDVYQLERACMYQLLAVGGGGEMQLIPEDVAARMGALARQATSHEHWDGMKRWIDAVEPDYRN